MPTILTTTFSQRNTALVDTLTLIKNTDDLDEKLIDCPTNDNAHDDLKRLEVLETKLNVNIKEQKRNLEPVIEECRMRQKQTFGLLEDFKSCHQDWRQQPASAVACSDVLQLGVIEGRSLQQYTDLASAYVNKL